jgi:glycosyltransferase involved in cell wall biosynthesis
MNLLHITPSFYPAIRWGGPIFSTFNLCNALHKINDLNLMVLTTNTTGPDDKNNLDFTEICRYGNSPYDIRYCHRIAHDSISIEFLFWLIGKIHWAEVVHLTAVYSFPTIPTLLLARILKKPVVWSPRGSLQRWEGTTRPRLKYCWETVCKAIVDHKTCCMHVTSRQEEVESKKIFPQFSYRIIKNGVKIPSDAETAHPMASRLLRILYIGRIHPIKGIENLLLGLSRLTNIDYRLTICGIGKPEYLKKIRLLCKQYGIESKIHFAGHVYGSKKKEVFANSDVCVVPSYTENFGIVVAESLAYGVPVICSKWTPWSDIAKHKCGIWTDNDPVSLANAIRDITSMDLHAMGKRGRQWMVKAFSWTNIADDMYDLYKKMIIKNLP